MSVPLLGKTKWLPRRIPPVSSQLLGSGQKTLSPKIIANLGRKDRLDGNRIRDMIRALSKLLPVNEAAEIMAKIETLDLPLKVNWAKSAWGIYSLRELWKAFGLKEFFEKKLSERRFEIPVEVAIFTMVAGRALAPTRLSNCV